MCPITSIKPKPELSRIIRTQGAKNLAKFRKSKDRRGFYKEARKPGKRQGKAKHTKEERPKCQVLAWFLFLSFFPGSLDSL
jgi:hypothetical protein